MDLTKALAPKSDQLDFADLDGLWRPSKGMLRVLADKWGKDVKVWIGRQVELYGDPDVYFGKERRGGTRISRMSHLTDTKPTLINPRGGRGAYWTVKALPDTPAPAPELAPDELAAQVLDGLKAATTEAEIREWGNRAHSRELLDIEVSGQVLRDHVTEALAVLADQTETGTDQ